MGNPNPLDPRVRHRAILRVISGSAQVFGAVVAIVLVLLTGVNAVTIGVAAATSLMTVTSLIL
jgi:hypothetical protein